MDNRNVLDDKNLEQVNGGFIPSYPATGKIAGSMEGRGISAFGGGDGARNSSNPGKGINCDQLVGRLVPEEERLD